MRWILLTLGLVLPAYSASVHGLVQTPEKRPISGAKIVIFHELSMVLVQRIVTDRNGVYRVNLASGPYRLVVLKQDYHPVFEKLLLRHDDAEKKLTHELVSVLTVADQENMRNLKHILRNSDREPLKQRRGVIEPQLAWQRPGELGLAGEIATSAKPGLDGSVGWASQVTLRSLLRDHIEVEAELTREQSERTDRSLDVQHVDAEVAWVDDSWSVRLEGGSSGESESQLEDGSQHLAASSHLSRSLDWKGNLDVRESRRMDGTQTLYCLDQGLRHRVGQRSLEHQMEVQRWEDGTGMDATSADYCVYLANGTHHPLGLSGHFSSLESGDMVWQTTEIRVSGVACLVGRKLNIASEVGVNRHAEEEFVVHNHRLTADFGDWRLHAGYHRGADFEAMSSAQVYGPHFRDPLVPDYFESFFFDFVTRSEMGVDVDFLGDWRGHVSISQREETADLVSSLTDEKFNQIASVNSRQGLCVLENRAWAGQLSVGLSHQSNEVVSFRQTEVAYAQEFNAFVDGGRIPSFFVMVKVARQPNVPGWWLLTEMPWNPDHQNTFYEGQLRMVF